MISNGRQWPLMWLQEFAISFHLKLDPAGSYDNTVFQLLMICLPHKTGCFTLADWHNSLVRASISYSMWTKIKFRISLLFWSSLHIASEAGSWQAGWRPQSEAGSAHHHFLGMKTLVSSRRRSWIAGAPRSVVQGFRSFNKPSGVCVLWLLSASG